MKIILNGEEISLTKEQTIADLINKFEIDLRKVAIEKNLEVIPQSEFEISKISEGDQIEIIHFIGGG